jgi:predicted Zn-ribbon and HTH transcriptional regulator
VTAALAVQILGMIWWFDWIETYIDDEILARGLGVLSILTSCGSVVTPILWKVQAVRRAGSVDSVPLKVKIGLECPRCHEKQTLVTGPARCAACGLRITIEVEEPRCTCGYLLYHLASDRCPECGREVAEADRWAVSTDPPSPPA